MIDFLLRNWLLVYPVGYLVCMVFMIHVLWLISNNPLKGTFWASIFISLVWPIALPIMFVVTVVYWVNNLKVFDRAEQWRKNQPRDGSKIDWKPIRKTIAESIKKRLGA